MKKNAAKRDKAADRLVGSIEAAALTRFGAGARFRVWCDTSDGDPRAFDSCLHRFPLRSGADAVLFPRSGDVLTGMLASELAQLLDPERAAQLAVYLHGLAGELADADEGDVAMVAGDIVRHIGDAVQDLTAHEHATPRQE